MADEVIKNHGAFIWSVADLLRGDYKPHEYGKVILPLTVLRRLDCVLEVTKATANDSMGLRPTPDQRQRPRATSAPRVRIEGLRRGQPKSRGPLAFVHATRTDCRICSIASRKIGTSSRSMVKPVARRELSP